MSYSDYLAYFRKQNKGFQQLGFNEPDFPNILRAIRFQRGFSQSGYGWWSNLLATVKPFLKNIAVPTLKNIGKEVGKGLLRSGVDIGERVLQGENLKTAAKEALKTRGQETMSNIGGVLKNQLGGRKRRIRLTSTENSPLKKQRLKRADQAYHNFLTRLRSFDVQKLNSLKRPSRKRRTVKRVRKAPSKKKTSIKKTASKTRNQIKKRRKKKKNKKIDFPGLY